MKKNNGDSLKVKVIIGSTRPGRFSDKPAKWITDLARKQKGWDVELLDLRDWKMPFYNEDHSLASKPGVYAEKTAEKWSKKIAEADAFIIVTPEYNHGTSGVLKNALDSAFVEWNDKPVCFVAHGSAGGARAVEHLRLNAIELQMAPIRSSVHIIAPWNLVDDKNNLKPGALDPFVHAAENMLTQLNKWGRMFKGARK